MTRYMQFFLNKKYYLMLARTGIFALANFYYYKSIKLNSKSSGNIHVHAENLFSNFDCVTERR